MRPHYCLRSEGLCWDPHSLFVEKQLTAQLSVTAARVGGDFHHCLRSRPQQAHQRQSHWMSELSRDPRLLRRLRGLSLASAAAAVVAVVGTVVGTAAGGTVAAGVVWLLG